MDYIAHERFHCRDVFTTPEGCEIWEGRTDVDGYPLLRYRVGSERIERSAHRIALEIKLGRDIRPGYLALHTCDTRHCVAAAHLYEGTHADNMRDVRTRDRQPNKKEPHREAKLSSRQPAPSARRPGCPSCGCQCREGSPPPRG